MSLQQQLRCYGRRKLLYSSLFFTSVFCFLAKQKPAENRRHIVGWLQSKSASLYLGSAYSPAGVVVVVVVVAVVVAAAAAAAAVVGCVCVCKGCMCVCACARIACCCLTKKIEPRVAREPKMQKKLGYSPRFGVRVEKGNLYEHPTVSTRTRPPQGGSSPPQGGHLRRVVVVVCSSGSGSQ